MNFVIYQNWKTLYFQQFEGAYPKLEERKMLFEIIFGRIHSLKNILAKTDLPIVGTVDQNVIEALALIVLESKSVEIDFHIVKYVLQRFQLFAHGAIFDGTLMHFSRSIPATMEKQK